MKYKHTQIGYLMIVVLLMVLSFFAWTYIVVSAEPESINSGTNFAITSVMVLSLFILSSFVSLKVTVDEKYLGIKFGYGIYKKKFLLDDIVSAKAVKNHWYYGWGIKLWMFPKMIIFNVSGFDAIEIKLKNGRIYRIGTDEPKELEWTLSNEIK